MEKLKHIHFSGGDINYNISFQLTGGGAALTLWKDDSAGTVVKKMEELVANLKQGILERALQ